MLHDHDGNRSLLHDGLFPLDEPDPFLLEDSFASSVESALLPPVVLPPLKASKPSAQVLPTVRELLSTASHDCSSPEGALQTNKSRVACMLASKDPCSVEEGEQRGPALCRKYFAELTDAISRMHGTYGLTLRSVSFFVLNHELWFVFVAKDAQTFQKWYKVNAQLQGAKLRVHRKIGSNRNSYQHVMEMFPGLSQRTLLNHMYEGEDLVPTPPRSRKRQASPLKQIQPAPPLLLPPLEKPASPPKRPRPSGGFAQSCVSFLFSSSVEQAYDAHELAMRAHLAQPFVKGEMGLHLLDGGLSELHAQVVYLKDLSFRVLRERRGLPLLQSLSREGLQSDSGVGALDEATRDALLRVLRIQDGAMGLMTFALYDRVSVLTFLSIHALRGEKQGASFLCSEAPTLAEVLPCSCSSFPLA